MYVSLTIITKRDVEQLTQGKLHLNFEYLVCYGECAKVGILFYFLFYKNHMVYLNNK
jgi:hypothetical protein